MSQKLIEAIRALPPEYVCDGTDVILCGDGAWPVASNGSVPLPPLIYMGGTWEKIQLYPL